MSSVPLLVAIDFVVKVRVVSSHTVGTTTPSITFDMLSIYTSLISTLGRWEQQQRVGPGDQMWQSTRPVPAGAPFPAPSESPGSTARPAGWVAKPVEERARRGSQKSVSRLGWSVEQSAAVRGSELLHCQVLGLGERESPRVPSENPGSSSRAGCPRNYPSFGAARQVGQGPAT
ncbi:uncharacterized protein B0I36DRAFT_87401 [Microdochium trichocladiopsis]|uniref:Uncharacterized protein n=1 Tax=Microdochium trichocladiopsis TaxID=1682393 RepID=A0A9P8YAR9_9PEZI|nr:uncharacterized protein B0I36DRAFT_87401 [Microdochium trichocladiopsis]KAH7035063.1 hypothetical protein B0I36DRAFT_87401 [Microdochium trichocladiopsis]